jgi:hypothetical protein
MLLRTDKKGNYDDHVERLHGAKDPQLVCTRPWCEATFSTTHELIEHRKTCLLKCIYCQKPFTNKYKYAKHVKGEQNREAKILQQQNLV